MRLLIACGVLAACGAPDDFGAPCTLIHAADTGGAEPLPKSDPAIAVQANADVLSLGVTDCSTRVCVRDAAFKDPPGDDPNAHGFCSAPCGLCPGGYECRSLALDQQTLDALRAADPARYKAIFGETTTPNFCVRVR